MLLPQKTMKPDSEFTYEPSDCRRYKGQKNMFKYTMRMLSVKSIRCENMTAYSTTIKSK